MERFDAVVVGAGWAGSVCAERLASAGKTVLLIDQRSHIGGNAYDYYDDAGILCARFGAHVWHTNSREIHDYVSQFAEWRPYEHRVLSSVAGHLLPVPINLTTLEAFDHDEAAAREAMVVPYTRKQWGPYADQLAPTVLARIKTRDTRDDRYFTDLYQAMPLHGYTRLFERMLAHPNIKILLKTNIHEAWPLLRAEWETPQPDVIYTGPIDEYFDYRFGRLPYRSATFTHRTFTENVDGCGTVANPYRLPVAVMNCPSHHVNHTRIIEFKHLTGQVHPQTTIAYECPQAEGEPYWPVPMASSAALYQQYRALAAQTPGVYFCGRLATYKYLDQDQVVAQALKLSTRLLSGETRHADAVEAC